MNLNAAEPGGLLLVCVTGDPDLGNQCRERLGTRFHVETCTGLHTMGERQGVLAFRMLVLCVEHTGHNRHDSIRLVRARWPSIRVLALSSSVEANAKQRVIGVVAGSDGMLQRAAEFLQNEPL